MNASDVSMKPAIAISGETIIESTRNRVELPFGATKIQAIHSERLAIVYVRQSSPQQVLEHRESAARRRASVTLATDSKWNMPSRSARIWPEKFSTN